MLASICRRRRLLLALREISVGGATHRVHPNPSTILLSHINSLTSVDPKSEPCPTTVSYLVSCGVSPATAAALKVRIRDRDKADAVRNLLREYDFTEAEVTRTVGKCPKLLTFNPDRVLRPKLDFLIHSSGFPPRMIATEPHMLTRSLDKHLAPCTDFLRGILGTNDAVSRIPRALLADLDNCMRPTVEAFRRHGLSDESIAKLLVIDVNVVFTPLGRIAEIFGDLKELGIDPTNTNFLYVFRVMCSLNRETWRRKVELYVSFGVSEDVVITAFKTQPTMMCSTEETIKRKVRFYQNALKLELSSLLRHPIALSLSLERCVRPRCAVLRILITEGMLQRKPKLLPALISNARQFTERFVAKHADALPDVVKAFEGKIKFDGFTDQELECFSSK